MSDFWTIFVAAIGFGAGGEAMRRYRRWKRTRVEAGFWTRRRLYLAEFAFCAAFVAIPWTAFVVLIPAGRPMWVAYPILLTYAGMTLLWMRGLNVGDV